MGTKTVKLSQPLVVAGKELSEVIVRRSTIGDEEDAMQQAIQLKKGKNPLTVEMCLMCRVARLPYDAVRAMHGPDYMAIREAMNTLNGNAPELETDDENPMTLMEDCAPCAELSSPSADIAAGPAPN